MHEQMPAFFQLRQGNPFIRRVRLGDVARGVGRDPGGTRLTAEDKNYAAGPRRELGVGLPRSRVTGWRKVGGRSRQRPP